MPQLWASRIQEQSREEGHLTAAYKIHLIQSLENNSQGETAFIIHTYTRMHAHTHIYAYPHINTHSFQYSMRKMLKEVLGSTVKASKLM